MNRVNAPVRRDVGQHLVSNVEICLRPCGVIERSPHQIQNVCQGLKGRVELVCHVPYGTALLANTVAMPFRASDAEYTSGMPEPRLYQFSTFVGTACNKQCRTFADLAEKLKIDVVDLMRQVNGKAAPSKALVKGLARELDISEPYLDKLAEEVRKDLGAK
jgi:hypothetical protein